MPTTKCRDWIILALLLVMVTGCAAVNEQAAERPAEDRAAPSGEKARLSQREMDDMRHADDEMAAEAPAAQAPAREPLRSARSPSGGDVGASAGQAAVPQADEAPGLAGQPGASAAQPAAPRSGGDAALEIAPPEEEAMDDEAAGVDDGAAAGDTDLGHRRPIPPPEPVRPRPPRDPRAPVDPRGPEPRRPAPYPERGPQRGPERGPPPRDMYFQDYGVNPWVYADEDSQSTFAMDVDTGSYTLARRYLLDGRTPPPAAVRVEEFVNYFEQGYPKPWLSTFGVHLDAAPDPFSPEGDRLLRVGIQGREVTGWTRKDLTLTFVVDVSGSMEEDHRLELVKDALLMLVDELGRGDEVALVAYTDRAWVELPMTAATDRRRIERAIHSLRPMNATNAEAGLDLGYDIADRHYRTGAENRVVLCSDGVANVGATGPHQILERIDQAAHRGITLTAIGVGMGNYNDTLLEQLADNGDGSYFYVDDMLEAERVFVDDLTGTFQVIARDAKVQVEFDPRTVEAYRLLGYENRDVADRDFRNDFVDAGEIGAGHSVTALYAVRLRSRADGEDTVATARVRYEDPESGEVTEDAERISVRHMADSLDAADPHLRLSVAAATFAEILRDSPYARGVALRDVTAIARGAARELDARPEVSELVELMERAERLSVAYGR